MSRLDQLESTTVLKPEIETVGVIGDVIESLHPEAYDVVIGRAITNIIHALRDQELFVQSSFHNGPQLFLAGSDAKRMYGGTPEIWRVPSAFWQGVVDSFPELVDDPVAKSLIRGGQLDTDIRFVLKPGANMDGVRQVVQRALPGLPCEATMEMKHHGASSQLRVLFDSKYHLDLGGLADFRRSDSTWEEQNRDDARVSLILPWRVFAPSCPVMDDDRVLVDEQKKASFWWAPVSTGIAIYQAGLDGVLVAWLRSKITDAFWPPKYQTNGIPSYYDTFTDDGFWREVEQNSIGREQRLTDRALEIASNTLLLLTLDPSAGAAMKSDGILDHLGLGKSWDGGGTFDPSVLACNLGVSMKELINLCYPIQ